MPQIPAKELRKNYLAALYLSVLNACRQNKVEAKFLFRHVRHRWELLSRELHDEYHAFKAVTMAL